MSAEIVVKAPAKVNLYLHVTGRRDDGYHLLDSLFVFAADGDTVRVLPAETLELKITGQFAPGLSAGEDNIVIKAARRLADEFGIEPAVQIVLEKNLPVASGIGGGSSDAAAVLKALLKLWKKEISSEKLGKIALELGADVPSCLAGKAVQVSGVGEILKPAPELPVLPVLLVNPNKPVPTPAVFKAREPVFSPPDPFASDMADFDFFINELKRRHNDLSEAACRVEPAVGTVLAALRYFPSCCFSAMSGSGGTCFGLFRSPQDAGACRRALQEKFADWWFLETLLV